MADVPTQKLLSGTFEIDETYVGGRQRGQDWRTNRKKEVVIGIRQRGGELRFFHAEDAKTGTLAKYIKENVSADVDVIVTDELPAYQKPVGKHNHETVNPTRKANVRFETNLHQNPFEPPF